jgi:alkylation response protein AidB-like acyl-CoA dehydrogenase
MDGRARRRYLWRKPLDDELMTDDFAEIRDAVARLCADFPGRYWRDQDRARAYPKEFVDALSAAGYLAVLIPEEYGGSGLGIAAASAVLEEIHKSGCNGAACHAQMYTMGTLLKHGGEAQKRELLPQIAAGTLRLQAFGVTEPTSGTDTPRFLTAAVRVGDVYRINGLMVLIS